jgi:hypothetical protein
MLTRYKLIPVALAAAVALSAGCTRKHARGDQARGATPTTLPPTREPATPTALAAPAPPDPPPLPRPVEPSVPPPRADALAGNVPPMPGLGEPTAPIQPASNEQYVSADGDRKPLRERLEERRQERKERREQRQNPPSPAPGMPSPFAPKTPATPPAAASAPKNDAVRTLIDEAIKRNAAIPDFEARLVKREVVNGKSVPRDEILYRFRQQPLSVYMKVLSDAGHGREVLYVKGQFGNKMHVITGKGDNILVGAGFKTEVDPDSRMATSKSRYRIYEAGFGRTLSGLKQHLATGTVRSLGQVKRPEFPYPLDGLDITIRPGEDPSLSKGGHRRVFLDAKPDSPSYRLPVLVITTDAGGREVEYYCFDRFRTPSGMTDADWNPSRLGKK